MMNKDKSWLSFSNVLICIIYATIEAKMKFVSGKELARTKNPKKETQKSVVWAVWSRVSGSDDLMSLCPGRARIDIL